MTYFATNKWIVNNLAPMGTLMGQSVTVKKRICPRVLLNSLTEGFKKKWHKC